MQENQADRFTLPSEVTEPASAFLDSIGEILGFLGTFTSLAAERERYLTLLVKHNHEAMVGVTRKMREHGIEIDDPSVDDWLQAFVGEGKKAKTVIEAHAQLLYELLLSRAVDYFLLYLAELLRLIYRKRLDIVKPDDVMASEFLTTLVEDYVERTSLRGMRRGLAPDFKNRFNMRLTDERTARRIDRILAKRNIIIHNRGIATRHFLKHVPDAGVRLGERITLSPEDVRADVNLLLQSVIDIDKRSATEFALPQQVLPIARPSNS